MIRFLTFISNFSLPLYDDLNKAIDSWTKLSSAIKFEGRYEVALVAYILKNTNDILRRDRTYD